MKPKIRTAGDMPKKPLALKRFDKFVGACRVYKRYTSLSHTQFAVSIIRMHLSGKQFTQLAADMGVKPTITTRRALDLWRCLESNGGLASPTKALKNGTIIANVMAELKTIESYERLLKAKSSKVNNVVQVNDSFDAALRREEHIQGIDEFQVTDTVVKSERDMEAEAMVSDLRDEIKTIAKQLQYSTDSLAAVRADNKVLAETLAEARHQLRVKSNEVYQVKNVSETVLRREMELSEANATLAADLERMVQENANLKLELRKASKPKGFFSRLLAG